MNATELSFEYDDEKSDNEPEKKSENESSSRMWVQRVSECLTV